eukprot:TRINITY_DN765_c0_g1_i18.p1 TRINITY_DN765_c0_g1~~TRINITY_DN765_c0_g1_i18.p1  ORF type:complete len:157 (+),score=15.98 TRINITY_DN765_c0_g1_i18:1379-1849(+)
MLVAGDVTVSSLCFRKLSLAFPFIVGVVAVFFFFAINPLLLLFFLHSYFKFRFFTQSFLIMFFFFFLHLLFQVLHLKLTCRAFCSPAIHPLLLLFFLHSYFKFRFFTQSFLIMFFFFFLHLLFQVLHLKLTCRAFCSPAIHPLLLLFFLSISIGYY